jgi:hydroxyacyl-ACP dehydratase HTD2-like protein with hotdog domain
MPFDVGNIHVGTPLPRFTRHVTRTTVFIFSAAYFGTHRFHYDLESARAEGFDDVIITSNLICSYFEQAVRQWTGDALWLRSLEERSISAAFAGSTLVIEGNVSEVTKQDSELEVFCDLTATTESGVKVSTCRIELRLDGVA